MYDCVNRFKNISIYLYDKLFEILNECLNTDNIKYTKIKNKKVDLEEENNTLNFEWDMV
jgi:hypothetical protein